MYISTSLTDGIAILAIRHPWIRTLVAVIALIGVVLLFFGIPVAIVAGVVWYLFFREPQQDIVSPPPAEIVVPEPASEPQSETRPPAPPVSSPVPSRNQAEPKTETESAYTSSNLKLLETPPPLSKEEHINAAQAALIDRDFDQATLHLKRAMQYDLQKSMKLSEDVRDLHKDLVARSAFMTPTSSSEIGEFVRLASEKYFPQWSAVDQSMYKILQSAINKRSVGN